MIIEDESDIRDLLQEIISALDLPEIRFDMTTAADGNIALTKLKERKFDLIITDLFLPGKRGDEIINQTRKGNGLNKTTPFIMISARLEEEGISLAKEINENIFFVEKPFELKKMERLVTLNLGILH